MSVRRSSPRLPGPVTAILLGGASFLLAAPFTAQAVGPSTHVEYSLSHTERVGGVNTTLTDTDLPPGVDGAEVAGDAGGVTGIYGVHTVSVSASVELSNDLPRLHARGEHSFVLSGADRTNNHWRSVVGTQTLRASHVDELMLSNVPAGPLTVTFFWDVHGIDRARVDLDPGDSVYMQFDTDVRLEATAAAPQSGGGTYLETVPWQTGYRNTDLDQEKELQQQEYVVMTFTVDPAVALEVETTFEVSPYTSLNNAIEGFASSLHLEGEHSALFDQSAELVGVVVRDALGNVLPDAVIEAASDFEYPVLDGDPVPPPFLGPVMLSPVAISDTDLGEASPTQAPLGNMINQSGLAKPFVSGFSYFSTYFDFNPFPYAQAHYSNNWQSEIDTSLPLTGYVDFDLGGTYSIDRLALWNISLQNIRVQISDSASGPWQELGAYTLPSHVNYVASYPPDVLDLGGSFEADYLRLQVDSAYKLSSLDNYTWAIVGEVAVSALPLPEPDAPWLPLAGVPAVALLAGRRRRSARSASES